MFTHLNHNFKWLKITHICLISAQIFINLDVETHTSFCIYTVIWSPIKLIKTTLVVISRIRVNLHSHVSDTGCKPTSGDIILTEKDQVRCFQNPNFVYYDNGTYCRGNIEYDNTCAWRIQVCFDKYIYCPLDYEIVYLPLGKEADTPYHILGYDISSIVHLSSNVYNYLTLIMV